MRRFEPTTVLSALGGIDTRRSRASCAIPRKWPARRNGGRSDTAQCGGSRHRHGRHRPRGRRDLRVATTPRPHGRQHRQRNTADRRLRLRHQTHDVASPRRLGTVEVVPAAETSAEVLARKPDGVFLSNGPGDPAMVGYAVQRCECSARFDLRICFGHKCSAGLSARQLQAAFGHHGGNHPVRHEPSVTSTDHEPDHNFCVDRPASTARSVTHLTSTTRPTRQRVLGCRVQVQYHPEAGRDLTIRDTYSTCSRPDGRGRLMPKRLKSTRS